MDPMTIISGFSGKASLMGNPKRHHKSPLQQQQPQPHVLPRIPVPSEQEGSSISSPITSLPLNAFSVPQWLLGVNLFDPETSPSNAVEPPSTPQATAAATREGMEVRVGSAGAHKYSSAGAMVVEGPRGNAGVREFMRSVSSVTTSPVSHLPGGEEQLVATTSLPKLSKKELKMAQSQLNKLTQINIHLHGKGTRVPSSATHSTNAPFLPQPCSLRWSTATWRRRAPSSSRRT